MQGLLKAAGYWFVLFALVAVLVLIGYSGARCYNDYHALLGTFSGQRAMAVPLLLVIASVGVVASIKLAVLIALFAVTLLCVLLQIRTKKACC